MEKLYIEPYSAEEIKEWREELGYSQKELAALAGCSKGTIGAIECNRNDSVPLRMLLTIILDDLEIKPNKEETK